MKKLMFLFILALFLSGCARTVHQPVPLDPCDQYARTAVSQNEENIRKDCGYRGAKWHSNYESHLRWCRSTSQNEADTAIEDRGNALVECPEKGKKRHRDRISSRCKHYAQTAVSQNQENVRRGCGYSGNLWHADYKAHYRYCRKVGIVEAEKKTDVRGRAIERCYPEDRCDAYARVAVWQNKDNTRRECGYRGRLWNSNYDKHFQWCRRVPPSEAEAANSARSKALKQCPRPGRKGPQKAVDRCEAYSNGAVRQNEENVRRNCGYTGGSWHSDYNAHYRWCHSVSSKSAKSATRAFRVVVRAKIAPPMIKKSTPPLLHAILLTLIRGSA